MLMKRLVLALWLACGAVAGTPSSGAIKTGTLSLAVTVSANGTLLESYLSGTTQVLTYAGEAGFTYTSVATSADGTTLTIAGSAANLTAVRVISLSGVTPPSGFLVSHTYRNPGAAAVSFPGVAATYSFAPATAGVQAWSQSIKLSPSDVVPHWQFKTPAVVLHTDTVLAAVVANVSGDTNATLAAVPPYLTLTNDGTATPTLTYGAANTALTTTNVYGLSGSPLALAASSSFTLTSTVVLAAVSDSASPWATVSSFVWQAFGRPTLLASADQQTNVADATLTTMDAYRSRAWLDTAQSLYSSVACPAPLVGEQCGIIASKLLPTTNGVGTDVDAWFDISVQTLRTAFGMLTYASQTNNATMVAQAQTVVNTAMSAPASQPFITPGGPFPAIGYAAANGSLEWVPSSGYVGLCRVDPSYEAPRRCDDWFHLASGSFTSFWALQFWRADTNITTVLPYVGNYAQFLSKVQRTVENLDGVIPSYQIYNMTQDEWLYSPFLETNNAEGGTHALFLWDLYAATSNPDVMFAAEKALNNMANLVVPTRQWYTPDLFWGASDLELNATDPLTQQPPASNIPMVAFSYAALRAYQVTKNASYLQQGRNVLDLAIMTQSVVNHPSLTPNTLGGFTTQNTNAEWSDSRTALFADVLLLYYSEVGDVELLERGVAALRAALTVSPYSSWAADGSTNAPGPDLSFHAGLGSAVTSAEVWREQFGSALFVVPLNQSVCIDGCTFQAASFNGTAVLVTISAAYPNPQGFTLVIVTDVSDWDLRLSVEVGTTGGGFQAAAGSAPRPQSTAWASVSEAADDDAATYAVVVNGHTIGSFTGEQLSDGVPVPAAAFGMELS